MITLNIEFPVGHITGETTFRPGEKVRVSGRVTQRIGTSWLGFDAPVTPQFTHFIDLSIGGQFLMSLNTNLVGNYWADVVLPVTRGSYIIEVDAGQYGYDTILITVSQVSLVTVFELSIDPLKPVVGSSLRATVLVVIERWLMPGVLVNLLLRLPDGTSQIKSPTTDSRGIVSHSFVITQAGSYAITASAPVIDREITRYFEAHYPVTVILPDKTEVTEQPLTPAPADYMPLVLGGVVLIGILALRKKGGSRG